MRIFLIIMLLNFSNHPSSQWPVKQKEEAKRLFGEVVDLPFPNIPPEATEKDIHQLTEEYLKKIMDIKKKNSKIAIHIMGEFTFTYNMVKELEKISIPCYASTTRRVVDEIKEDEIVKKISRFEFISFRKYF